MHPASRASRIFILDDTHEIWYNVLMTHDIHLSTHALGVQLDLLRYHTRTELGRSYSDAILRATIKRRDARRKRGRR